MEGLMKYGKDQWVISLHKEKTEWRVISPTYSISSQRDHDGQLSLLGEHCTEVYLHSDWNMFCEVD
jgi:hypothetical protein